MSPLPAAASAGPLRGRGHAGDSLRARCSGVRALADGEAAALGDWPGNVTAGIVRKSWKSLWLHARGRSSPSQRCCGAPLAVVPAVPRWGDGKVQPSVARALISGVVEGTSSCTSAERQRGCSASSRRCKQLGHRGGGCWCWLWAGPRLQLPARTFLPVPKMVTEKSGSC